MYTYLLETATTMKPHNNKKWWIDSGIIQPVTVKAENINDALKQYQTIVKDKFYIDISDNALKHKNEMFVDTKQGETIQTGYVITGKYEFDNDYGKFVQQYIDLWVTINIITNPFTEELKND